MANRELDAQVAEEVMGEPKPTIVHEHRHIFEHIDSPLGAWYCSLEYDRGDVCEWHPKHYSSRIQDAKLTTNKVLEMSNVSEVIIVGRADGGWNVGFLDADGISFAGAFAGTEEEARCLAALEAVRGEQGCLT